jgi:hypothetical protein
MADKQKYKKSQKVSWEVHQSILMFHLSQVGSSIPANVISAS